MDEISKISRGLQELSIEADREQCGQLFEYYRMLVEKNKVMNLTAITDFDEVVLKHFVDSAALVKIYDLENKEIRLLDMGTGAGFPGIPLKILFPKLQVVLLDSLNKRIKFLQEVAEALSLEGIEAVHGRAEEYGRKENFRESFDLCVSRAVANMATLSEYCIPYVKKGGYFIPYKSGNIEEELSSSQMAVKVLGGKVEEVKELVLPGSDIKRTFVKIKKLQATNKKYPRMGGKPSREPICSSGRETASRKKRD